MAEETREQLIERIVREVLRRVQQEEAPSKRKATGPRLAIVLSETVSDRALQTVRSFVERGYLLAAIACGRRMPTARRHAVRDLHPELLAADEAGSRFSADTVAVVAPELGLGDAAKLALGILDDAPVEWLWTGLASGIPVLATPGEGFGTALPSALKRVAASHRSACTRLGVRWVEADELGAAVESCVAAGSGANAVHLLAEESPTLVTEAVIASLAEGTKALVLPGRAVVTPLAKDAARRRGIELRRQ